MKKLIKKGSLLSDYYFMISSLYRELMTEDNSREMANTLTLELGKAMRTYLRLWFAMDREDK